MSFLESMDVALVDSIHSNQASETDKKSMKSSLKKSLKTKPYDFPKFSQFVKNDSESNSSSQS